MTIVKLNVVSFCIIQTIICRLAFYFVCVTRHALIQPGLALKGQCHEIYIFFEGLNIFIGNFCVCADGFHDLSKAFHYPIHVLTFYLLL